jgi:hypothetical protein
MSKGKRGPRGPWAFKRPKRRERVRTDGRVYDDHGALIGRVDSEGYGQKKIWKAFDTDDNLLENCPSKRAAALTILERTCTFAPGGGWTKREG